jgi:CubicO group peptidase (beta-lactamase class C family)
MTGSRLMVLAAVLCGAPRIAQPQAVFPAASWTSSDPASAGWSVATLDSARTFWSTLPTASVMIVERGRVIAAWGDTARRVKVSSIRKSFLSALFGEHVRAGRITLDQTLQQLSIDDVPPLNSIEKTATVRMLLQSRSGIYHAYVGGSPDDRARMPQRGSHPVGSFWYYNNWDFNAVGTIFEQLTKTGIGDAFLGQIARPTQMQDFRRDDMYYFGGTEATRSVEQSIHPAYHFRMSARDLARFGYLFLRRGTWNGRQLIPADWVTESTAPYSGTENGGGYGYLWWTNQWAGLGAANYSAQGALGKYIIIVPERDLVIVYLNQTEFPDDAAAIPAAQVASLPTATRAQVNHLLALVIRGQRPVR